ncbi:MAG: DUF5696 domain-containing protein [Firmicutes bacterium]|nr:DUF5696 domain-containing protein [Bacillota bacterium]
MVNLIKLFTIMTLASMMTIIRPQVEDQVEPFNNNQMIMDNNMLSSNRFTQEDDYDQDQIDAFNDLYQVNYNEEERALLGYLYSIENARYILYFEPMSFSVLLYDKVNDYMMSSRAEFQGISGERENNTATRNRLNSGLWLSYVRKANVSQATETTVSLYDLADVDYVNNGSVTETQSQLSTFEIVDGSYDERDIEVSVLEVNQVLIATVDAKAIDSSLEVHLSLNERGLEVYIPADKLIESGDIYGLTSISVFPYFGSVRENLAPGYMLIPDQVGGLIRFEKPIEATIRALFYGGDQGLNDNTRAYLSLPVVGMIHDVNQQGFYVSIDEGAELSELEAVFWSSRTRYYRTQLNFQLRPIYKAIINAAGDGRDQIPDALTNKDYRATYTLLGDDANYVGIANHYQTYLLNEGELVKQEVSQIPYLLQFLMGDQTPSFLGTTYLEMTSAQDAEDILNVLLSRGVTPSVIGLLGWSRDGAIDQAPYRLRDIHQLEDLEAFIKSQNMDILRHQEYVMSSELSERIGFNRDVALNYSRLKMTTMQQSLNAQSIDQYFVYPDRSLALSNQDDLKSAYLTSIGRMLNSYYDQGFYDRIDTRVIYDELLSSYDMLMLSQPSLYALKYANYYTHMPIIHSQYYFYTDTVPFVPIVLSGILPIFSSELNFNAIGDVLKLQMLDYGMYPNFIVTEQPTQTMRFTRSNIFFTTHIDVFEDEIVSTYNQFKRIYDEIGFQKVIQRDVLDLGIVLVTYEDQTQVLINYTNDTYMMGSYMIDALSAEVIA